MTQVKYSSIELDKAIYVPPKGLVTALNTVDATHGAYVKSIVREGDTVTIETAEGLLDIPWAKCVKAKQAEAKKKA